MARAKRSPYYPDTMSRTARQFLIDRQELRMISSLTHLRPGESHWMKTAWLQMCADRAAKLIGKGC